MEFDIAIGRLKTIKLFLVKKKSLNELFTSEKHIFRTAKNMLFWCKKLNKLRIMFSKVKTHFDVYLILYYLYYDFTQYLWRLWECRELLKPLSTLPQLIIVTIHGMIRHCYLNQYACSIEDTCRGHTSRTHVSNIF